MSKNLGQGIGLHSQTKLLLMFIIIVTIIRLLFISLILLHDISEITIIEIIVLGQLIATPMY